MDEDAMEDIGAGGLRRLVTREMERERGWRAGRKGAWGRRGNGPWPGRKNRGC